MEKKQCLFPWSKPFGYNKLSSSSIPENQQPLLDNHCDHYKTIEMLDSETKSNIKEIANLKRRIVTLEDEIVKLRASMKKTGSMAEITSLQATVLELKSRLDSSATTQLPLVSIEPEPDMGRLQNQVTMLIRTVNELKFNNLMNHNGQELEKIRKKNTELEKILAEVRFSIAHLKLHKENSKPSSSGSYSVQTQEEEERTEMLHQITRPIPESMESYFMILIFFISVLIGATIY